MSTAPSSRSARWGALALLSLSMLAAYYVDKVIAPLKPLLEAQLGWNSSDYGFFRSGLGWINVFCLGLVFAGIILDRKGVRFTGLMAGWVMIGGALLQALALVPGLVPAGPWFGVRAPVLVSAWGLAVFSFGLEAAGITVSKAIVQWFQGRELALAMGLQLSVARLGTGLGMLIAAPLALRYRLATPVLLGVFLLGAGLLAFFGFSRMDRRIEAARAADEAPEEGFRLRDIGSLLGNSGFWLVALLCLLFYGGVFPFLENAPDLMVQKYGIAPSRSGAIPSLLPLGTILLTPIFGRIYDRKGHGVTIMLIGALLLVLVHGIFALPFLRHWGFAVVAVLLLGVAFSLVPSAMWPALARIIPQRQLGTAYALTFYLQNIGLAGIPFLVNRLLDRYCRSIGPEGAIRYDYTLPMLVFMGFGVAAVFVALALKREDRRKGYGLERSSQGAVEPGPGVPAVPVEA